MPSRKKAQGQARKAKRAAEAQNNPTSAAAACHHLGQPITNWSRDDQDAVLNLVGEYDAKFKNAFEERKFNRKQTAWLGSCIFDVVANLTYNKYHQFNDARKELFRRTMLVRGTEACMINANEIDSTKKTMIEGPISHLLMFQIIEVRDKHNGAWDADINAKIHVPLNEIVACSRQIIRFFHKRNYCDCLQQIYCNLKEETERTAICRNCMKLVGIKQISQCAHCESVTYCSYECAVADWSKHKDQCKELRECRELKEENRRETMSKSLDDIEQVD